VDYQPQKINPYGDDWVVYPVDGYGSQETVRSILRTEKPDILWFMTDPRFFGWLWEMEDEIRPLLPMVYYHVWDNLPYPDFNKIWYDSCDHIACISKVTYDIVKTVAPDTDSCYLPHAVNSEVFKPFEEEEIVSLKEKSSLNDDKFTVFWNNRNARRKQSGSLIFWFAKFLEKVGRDKARLIMHTDPKDPNGPDLVAQVNNLGLTSGEVQFSKEKVDLAQLAAMYNISDVTVNISDAEGFGLATLESLSCGTPIIVNMTGGLQEQVTDGESWFGIGIKPSSKAIIGSQDIPYIYEDRINEDDFVDALEQMYNMSKEERKKLGQLGREHVLKNYNFKTFQTSWKVLIKDILEKFGSWEDRKDYKSWELTEV
jgi:glycosyltransferase involved in cell wall biosynthesis